MKEIEYVEPDEQTKLRTYSWSLLVEKGLKHSYGGTVPAHVKARRRAADKVAKQSRRVNRGNR